MIGVVLYTKDEVDLHDCSGLWQDDICISHTGSMRSDSIFTFIYHETQKSNTTVLTFHFSRFNTSHCASQRRNDDMSKQRLDAAKKRSQMSCSSPRTPSFFPSMPPQPNGTQNQKRVADNVINKL